ncbi:hypothetical protein [Marinifilum sp.]|uniref:hypothetical protein n=1 Tax=Marinifilum sp. TaxID=2033137 RepID=UPI003BAA5734
MNRFLTLSIMLLALLGFTSNAMAQGTGTGPAIGSTHSYWVNSTDGTTHDSGVGNDYLWYITKGDLTSVNTSDFIITTAAYADASTAVQDLYRIDITWLAASAGSTYYLHVIETDAKGCSNHKAEIINPFSDFQLAITNVDKSFADVANNFETCAPDVALSLNSGAIEYNYGTTTLYYKIDATNIDKANFTLGYNIAVDAAYSGNTATADYGTVSGTTYTSTANLTVGGNQTVDITNTENSATIYVRVQLPNSTAFEGLVDHGVLVTLTSGSQGVAAATLEADADENQIVPARPSTSGIGSN